MNVYFVVAAVVNVGTDEICSLFMARLGLALIVLIFFLSTAD
jgi:hypothetical protein